MAVFDWKGKGSIFAGGGLGSGGFKQEKPWEKVVRIWVGETVRNQGKFLFPGKYKDNGRSRTIIYAHWRLAEDALVGLPCPHFLQDREN